MKEFIFITGNQNKADILQNWLGHPVEHHKLDLDEIQSLDLHEVAEHKARQAYNLLKKPVLIEDASLTFISLKRLPGTLIKWFIEDLGVEGLARLAFSLPSQEAHGHVAYAYYDGSEDVLFFDGHMRGRIAPEPKGENGFGFDAIFINDGFNITRGQMTDDVYRDTSYRSEAMNKLRVFLKA